MNVTAATLDRMGVDHAVYRRVRTACRYGAIGIDLDEHALNVAVAVSAFRHANNDGPGGASQAENARHQGQTGEKDR